MRISNSNGQKFVSQDPVVVGGKRSNEPIRKGKLFEGKPKVKNKK